MATLLKISGGFDFSPYIAANGYEPLEDEVIEQSSKQLATGWRSRVVASGQMTTIKVKFRAGISVADTAAILAALKFADKALFEYWSRSHGHMRKALFTVKKESATVIVSVPNILYSDWSMSLEQADLSSDLTSTFTSKFAGAVDSSDGTWSNPANIQANDGNYVTTLGGLNTDWDLKLSNFGFTIPAGAIINSVGIFMKYKMSTAASSSILSLFAAYKGTKRGVGWTSADKPTADVTISTGGGTGWTVDQLNSNDLQVFIRVRRKSSVACTFSFDYAYVVVEYTEAG